MGWTTAPDTAEGVHQYDRNLARIVAECNYFYQGKPDDQNNTPGPYNHMEDGDTDMAAFTLTEYLTPICESEESKADRFTIHRIQ